MPTPAERIPVRVVRGTKAELDAVLADLPDGEICVATDINASYVVEGGAFTETTLPNQIDSNTTLAGGGTKLDNLVSVTQTNYDALTPAANTAYIVEAPAAPGGDNPLTATAGETINSFGDYTGDNIAKTIPSTSELAAAVMWGSTLSAGEDSGAFHWNLDEDDALNIPEGYSRPVERFSGVSDNLGAGGALFAGANGFDIDTSNYYNQTGQLFTYFGIRKDGSHTITNGVGPDSTIYVAPDSGIQICTWVGDGSASQTVRHGCGVTPSMMFWMLADGDGNGSSGGWWWSGPLLASVTAWGAAGNASWNGDGAPSVGADRIATFDTETFTTCSNTYFEFNGDSNSRMITMLFYDVAGKSASGVAGGPGGSVLSINTGFRPSVVFSKGESSTDMWQVNIDSASNMTAQWGQRLGSSDYGASINTTITGTGFDIADGTVGNNGTGELMWIAIK